MLLSCSTLAAVGDDFDSVAAVISSAGFEMLDIALRAEGSLFTPAAVGYDHSAAHLSIGHACARHGLRPASVTVELSADADQAATALIGACNLAHALEAEDVVIDSVTDELGRLVSHAVARECRLWVRLETDAEEALRAHVADTGAGICLVLRSHTAPTKVDCARLVVACNDRGGIETVTEKCGPRLRQAERVVCEPSQPLTADSLRDWRQALLAALSR